MTRTARVLLAVAAVAALSRPASAHFAFLLPDLDGKRARLVLSEDLVPDPQVSADHMGGVALACIYAGRHGSADGGTMASLTVDVFDPATATGKWSTAADLPDPDDNGFGPAAVDDGKLFASVADGSVYALDDAADRPPRGGRRPARPDPRRGRRPAAAGAGRGGPRAMSRSVYHEDEIPRRSPGVPTPTPGG